jgi:hypothetical protein
MTVTSGDYHCNYFIFTVTSGDYHCNYFIFTVTSGDYQIITVIISTCHSKYKIITVIISTCHSKYKIITVIISTCHSKYKIITVIISTCHYHCNYFIFTVTSGDYHCNYFIFTVTSGDYHCNYFIFTSSFPWAWVEEGLGCLGFLFLLRLQKHINIYCYSKISTMKICVIIDGLLSQSESVQVYQCFTVWNLVISDPLMFLSQFFFIYMFEVLVLFGTILDSRRLLWFMICWDITHSKTSAFQVIGEGSFQKCCYFSVQS